jgi:hypothetical protein
LQQFRQLDTERTIWADGLCINQAKEAEEERLRQVNLMGVIYQKAQHCLIWLGRGPDDAEICLDATKQLIRIEAEFNATSIGTDPIFMSPEEKARHNIPYGQTSHLRGLQLILSNTWLTRVWIVQEASLAQKATIYLGDGSVAWDDLSTALAFASSIGLLHLESQLLIDGMKAIRMNRVFQDDRLLEKGENNVLALFARFRNFEASYAENKINGLISLMSEKRRSQWPVGTTADQAFMNAAHQILEHSQNLDLLGIPRHIDSSEPTMLNISSWVPDWTSRQVPVSLRMLEFAPHGATKFAATRDSSYNMQLSHDGRLLGVDGYRVCSIQSLGEIHLYRPIDIEIPKNGLLRKRIETILALVDTYFNWTRTLQLGSAKASYPHSATPMTMHEALMKTFTAYDPLLPQYHSTDSRTAFRPSKLWSIRCARSGSC